MRYKGRGTSEKSKKELRKKKEKEGKRIKKKNERRREL